MLHVVVEFRGVNPLIPIGRVVLQEQKSEPSFHVKDHAMGTRSFVLGAEERQDGLKVSNGGE